MYATNITRLLVNLLVQFVDLLRKNGSVQQLVGVATLGSQQNAVSGQDAQAGASMGNGLHRIFDLIQSTY